MQKRSYARRRVFRRKEQIRFYIILATLITALGAGIFFIVQAVTGQPGSVDRPAYSVALAPPETSAVQPGEASPSPEASPTPTAEPSFSADLAPQAVTGKTDPAAFGFKTDIMSAGKSVDSFTREKPIRFGSGDEYTALEGVITFRGNNYRDAPSWGTAAITAQKLESVREPKQTSRMGTVKSWGGMGWTGQPLVVKWPEKTRESMKTLYSQFRTKEGFTEVIFCSLDGRIYFEELETGEKTRNPINTGAPIKGTASLDPRGIPIIYVGQGLQSNGDPSKSKKMYFRAYSLIDGKGLNDGKAELWGASTKDPFALQSWQAYDSSPLIDAETDTLIEPGENGVIYTMKLNTKYDEEAGKVTMDPGPLVKYRYTSTENEARDKGKGGRWGIESSAVAWRNYLMFTDNAGMLQCLDLNTMKLVYANDMGNDSDVTMVLEEDPAKNTFYLYTGCEYDDEAANVQPGKGTCYARKINGITGEIIWEVPYTVDSSDTNVDGGIVASPVLGKENTSLAGLIIYNVSVEVKGDSTTSRLAALDKLTGKEVWSYDMDVEGWSPSSPVPVYTEDGQGYIVQCDKDGDVALIKADGKTCAEVSKLPLKVVGKDGEVNVQNSIEATPAVFGNYIVVGSRNDNLFFIKIS